MILNTNRGILLHFLSCCTALLILGTTGLELAHAQSQGAKQNSATAPSAVSRAAALANGQAYFVALVIGIDDYLYLDHLQTAVRDAEDVSDLLRNKFGFDIKLLRNPTREQIMDALNGYRSLDENANLLVYYAGHGSKDDSVQKAYWLPVDARPQQNASWISADDITTNLRGIAARHILVVSDSCYAGELVRDANARITPVIRDRALKQLREGTARLLIASGGNEPVADKGGEGHSVFANAFITALSQNDENAFAAGDIFFHSIRPYVIDKAKQTPIYEPLAGDTRGGDFIFTRLNQVVSNGPSDNAVIHAQRGDELRRERHYDQAIDEYAEAVRQDPNNADYHAQLGGIYLDRKNYRLAEMQYQECVRIAPAFAAYHIGYGIAFYFDSKYSQAEEQYRAAVQLEPTSLSHVLLGNALEAEQKYEEASKEFREALRLDPSNEDAKAGLVRVGGGASIHENRANAAFQKGDLATAETEWREAVKLTPNEYMNRGALCATLLREKKLSDAEQECKQTLIMAPSDPTIIALLGEVFYAERKFTEAEVQMRQAIRLESPNAFHHNTLGLSLEGQHRYVEAEAEFREALKIKPDFEEAQSDLRRVETEK